MVAGSADWQVLTSQGMNSDVVHCQDCKCGRLTP
jgi:hypothetical protein